MSGMQGMAYAQARIQARYGRRADAAIWLKLQNIHDLGSYLQTAQQTPLRHWILGISPTHDSHEIELTLRQKYRLHIDEVANWVPASWRRPLCWIKRLPDLPSLQYLATGGEPLDWMKKDPDLSDLTLDEETARLQAMREAGVSPLIDALRHEHSPLEGWITEWHRVRPRSHRSDDGFRELERAINQLIRSQTSAQVSSQASSQAIPAASAQAGSRADTGAATMTTDYDSMFNQFRRIFRRYAFQPASVCAYLAIVMIDLHRIRSDLLQRRLFADAQPEAKGLPL